MRHAVTLLTVAAMFTCGLADGQDELPPTTKEHLKVLQPFVGEWVIELTAYQDNPLSKVKEGETYTMQINYSWLFDNTAMLWEWIVKNNSGESTPVYTALFGWNAESKSIVAHGVNGRGNLSTEVLKPEDQKWTMTSEYIGADRRSSIVRQIVFIDDSTMAVQEVERDGQAVDVKPGTFKRKKN